VGTYLLLFVGGLDDRSVHGARGLVAHLKELARGHATTGIWKLAAGVGLSLFLAVQLGGGLGRVVLSALVIALSINVTNAMDVRPGRALKWAGLWLLPVSFLAVTSRLETGMTLAYGAYLASGLGVLWFDLGEKGMLGDAGSNPLGLVLGAVLAAFLPLPWLIAILAILLALQLAAETVTISRLIEDLPPLRWFDRLGRGS
jgi:UDP-N-acetylmuramyl pentapeptide phosphotransferase/UDP-N-acetylglucosamine-1-phosphate transferase